jgi:hypothetical protein
LRKRSHGGGEAGAVQGGAVVVGRGGSDLVAFVRRRKKTRVARWAAWAKWDVKPGGPGWCRFGLAGRPRPRDGEASVPG